VIGPCEVLQARAAQVEDIIADLGGPPIRILDHRATGRVLPQAEDDDSLGGLFREAAGTASGHLV